MSILNYIYEGRRQMSPPLRTRHQNGRVTHALVDARRLRRIAPEVGGSRCRARAGWPRRRVDRRGFAPSYMGYLAARTDRVGIASGILPLYTRTPSLLAMTAAGIDGLSDGRCILGLGAGLQGVRSDSAGHRSVGARPGRHRRQDQGLGGLRPVRDATAPVTQGEECIPWTICLAG